MGEEVGVSKGGLKVRLYLYVLGGVVENGAEGGPDDWA